MSQNDTTRVGWGTEVLRVLRIIGRVLFKIFSYFMNILLTVLLIGLITGVIVCTVFAIYVNNYLDLEIDPSIIVNVNRDSATRIYYMDYETAEDRLNRNGTAVEIEDQRLSAADNKIAVSYDQLPENLKNAFIAVEDKRFLEHNGVDWVTTFKAVAKFIFGGSGGGSTITQQLIKNVTGEDAVTIQRKVEEIFRALNLEREKSKSEILESYMNVIYLGQGQYGVQQAATYYFGKDVSELSLVECAAIAAIVKNPSQYNPESHEEDFYVYNAAGEHLLDENGEWLKRRGNDSRRDTVLELMKQEGFITAAECAEAQAAPLVLASHTDDEEEELGDGMTLYNWYTESLISELANQLSEMYKIEYKAAVNMIYYNGLKIYIPMDPEVQSVLEEVYTNDTQYFPSTGTGLQPQSACVICDPATNDVLGIVGGRGRKTINRGTNRASVATRPPGSSIKPLAVYGPALDMGLITYGSVVDDSPVFFNSYDYGNGYYGYDPYPQNYPVGYRGLTTINDAITRSVNTVAMKVLQKLTVDKSFDFMKNQLEFDSLIESATKSNGENITDKGLAALSLGQPNYGVTLLEMTAGYQIFNNHGVFNSPNLFVKVTDAEGNVIIDNENGKSKIVIKDETASIMTIMLQNVMNKGTGTGCTLRHTVDVAGKTGTTNADFDRYFVGYTPYYTCGVWTGYDMNQSLSAFGENPSLVVWDKVMTMLHQKYIDEAANGGEPLKKFERAPGVIEATYCIDSGKLPTDTCQLDPRGSWRRETGYFTRETVPTDYCDTHVLVKKDSTTGLVASPQCNPANCYYVALIREETRSFPIQIYIGDAQYTYRDLPSGVKPGGWWGDPFFVNTLGGMYCGSSYVDVPANAYCYKHCDYRPWGGYGPAEDSGINDDESKETSPGDDTATDETTEPEVDETTTPEVNDETETTAQTEESYIPPEFDFGDSGDNSGGDGFSDEDFDWE